ncbi:LysM peptidoglycan-binding domain-containing protein [Paracoccus aminophilus]|uniref:LysM domain-containing protein n=1 Tax=Paracoccus aminophilus JCM 7686 TaxID=1367847 RepID=S5XNI3_PARAH|nr:LysM domain-containing protein [Paracoccus aminophilus]AGT08889.1 hypothetical protein JCM7686_1788 [Paracoccus aminophilus JCM 7686]
MLLDGPRTHQNRHAIPPQPNPPAPNPGSSSGSGSAAGPARSTPDQGGGVNSGLGDAALGLKNGTLLRDGIAGLNGDGDSTYLRITPELKAQGNWRGLMVGGKAQLGADLRVTQNGEGPDATYTVRYDKQALGALTAEAGTDTLGKGGAGKAGAGAGGGPDARLKAEAGVQTFDAVEMTFATKDEATRAAEALQRLHLADALSDGTDLALSALGPGGAPLKIAKDAVSGGGTNPLGNPLNADGMPGKFSRDLAGVSDEDMGFLRDHVSAYETTIGTRGRLAAELKGDMSFLKIAGEGRLDETQRITRRVELPTAEKDGSVTYTLQGGLRASGKEKAQKGFNINGLPIEPKFENRLDLGSTTAEISLHYRLPKGEDVTTSGGGRPVPELDALSGTGGMELESISLKSQLDWRDQSLADPSRADMQRQTATVTFTHPDRIGTAAEQFLDGDFRGAARTAGVTIDLTAQDIDRTGVNTQTGVKVKGGVAEAEVSLIYEAGTDDVTTTASLHLGADDQPAPPPLEGEPRTEREPQDEPQTRLPPDPEDDGKTRVVLPTEGVRLRDAPEGESRAILQNGTFLRDQGERQTDASGQDWIKVSATDLDDKPVEGWVRADLTGAHSSATGAMDGSGRINPTLEHQRYDAVTVQDDDNLWNIATEHGIDPQELIALNRDHLLNPSLIFKGDTVYLPGTARGPEPEAVAPAAPPETPAPETPTPEAPPAETGSGGTGSTPERGGSSAEPEAPRSPPGDEASGERDGTESGPDQKDPDQKGSEGKRAEQEPAPSLPPAGGAPGTSSTPAAPEDRREASNEHGPKTDADPSSSTPVQPGPVLGPPIPGPQDQVPQNPAPERRDLNEILQTYQVKEDTMTEYHPQFGPFPIRIPFVGGKKMTQTEADLLDKLGSRHGLAGLDEFKSISSNDSGDPGLAYRTADEKFPRFDANGAPIKGAEDGHNDAFRHAYWNALMSDRFGEDFAAAMSTAHEGVPENPAAKEAMDLYNNEVGRRIARENPGASDEELANKVEEAVRNGEMVVIDANGNLAWSDQVEVGQTGDANPEILPGELTPPDYSSN